MEQELELHRLKSENAELKKRISDFATIENAKKKLEVKVDQMEQKVSGPSACCSWSTYSYCTDGYPDSREGFTKGE